ncbi:hypothetical protein B0H17DRAFT_1148904 [Mycena rosella]|uniref:Uncharacterized protein n=1 Tax=Mycena rosella TaxID=1033263 RepID=A0AAD7C6L1_MYCRO|nr:hypothetical protein B0H17DRAFT_1148904 [Mycena rosella]
MSYAVFAFAFVYTLHSIAEQMRPREGINVTLKVGIQDGLHPFHDALHHFVVAQVIFCNVNGGGEAAQDQGDVTNPAWLPAAVQQEGVEKGVPHNTALGRRDGKKIPEAGERMQQAAYLYRGLASLCI